MWDDYSSPFDFSVGTQSDGTTITPTQAIPSAPVDAGGGAPASYGQDVIDVFKFGVGIWAANKRNEQMLDYKRYEATQNGLWMQGRPAVFGQNTNGGGMGGLAWMAIIGIAAVVLLNQKG